MVMEALLVEDSPVIRENLIPVLEEFAGIRVSGVAETAATAVELALGSAGWRLMVLDLFLAEGNGLLVLEALKSRSTDQMICVLTNYATQATRERCLALGANAVFDKSTELEAFFDYCTDLGTLDLNVYP